MYKHIEDIHVRKYKDGFETKDLLLKKASMEDLESIYNNFWSQEETAKYMLWKVCKNLEEARERLEKIIDFQKDNMAYFVYEKQSGQAIGIAGMKEIEPGVFEDAGIGVGKQFVGRGYGKQILNAFIDYLANELKAKRIICSCDAKNVASAKLQQSCGLNYTHSENMCRKKDNKKYVSDYYELMID